MLVFCLNCSTSNDKEDRICNKCGTVLENCPKDVLGPNLILNERYRLITPLKTGGMGGIYVGKDLRLNTICAVKELFLEIFPEEEKNNTLERFKQEAEILAKLRHPNLPCVTDYFLEDEKYYLIMDYIDGEDLGRVLKREGDPGLNEKQVVRWGVTICEVLEYLHSQNPPIIYRDLKPSNIMLRKKDYRIMLVDFGVAKFLEKKQKYHTAIGTEGFSPREQYRGLTEPRSDIYALGATLHHLLTKATLVPFRFKPIRHYNPRLSPKLESILMKALQDKIEYRYKNAAEMKKDLLMVLDEEPATLIDKIRRKLDDSIAVLKNEKQEGEKIKVFIVEDERNLRVAFEKAISYSKDMEVIGTAATGRDAIEQYKELEVKPHVILMDISMPGMDGIETTGEIKKLDPSVKVIILTALTPDKELVLSAFRAGAMGYLIKGIKLTEIVEAIRKAYEGGSPIEPAVATYLLDAVSQKTRIPEEPEKDEDYVKFDLNEIDFINLLIELCSKEITGKISVTCPVENGEVYLEKGNVIHCKYGKHIGKKALSQVINWKGGKGIFYPDVLPEFKTVEEDTDKLLAELITAKDQLEKIKDVITSNDDVFHLDLPTSSAIVKLQSNQLYILAYLDGKNSIDDIARKTGRNHFEISKAIYELSGSNLVRKIK